MANDLLYFTALAAELKQRISGAKIEKIYQPAMEEIVFVLRGNPSESLFFSASANTPRVCVITKKRENPLNAPAFCMLLRKRLAGGVITDIETLNSDRILRLSIRTRTDMRDDTTLYFIAEMMGRCSNLILTNNDGVIIDAVKRIPIGGTSRPILPNLAYQLQPHGKIRLDESARMSALDWGDDEKGVVQRVSGLSKETAKEIIALGKSSSPYLVFSDFYERAKIGIVCPTVVLKNGAATELYPFEYSTAEGEKKIFATLSQATEFYYENRTESVTEDVRIRELKKAAAKLSAKLEKKRLDALQKQENTQEIDKNKLFGELIYNNIYKAKGGESILDCDDYENSCIVSVPLDTMRSASDNAAAYYKKYRKLKRAQEIAEEQLAAIFEEKEYLETVCESLPKLTTAKEIAEAEDELKTLAGKRRQPAPKGGKREKPSSPLKTSVFGFVVYVGKNNVQNDEITFRIADRADIWLHVKSYHGSHVLIKTDGKSVSENVILRAAELAAYYSEAKGAPKAEVDYTQKRFVKRKGASLGLVNYTDFNTVLVEPKQ